MFCSLFLWSTHSFLLSLSSHVLLSRPRVMCGSLYTLEPILSWIVIFCVIIIFTSWFVDDIWPWSKYYLWVLDLQSKLMTLWYLNQNMSWFFTISFICSRLSKKSGICLDEPLYVWCLDRASKFRPFFSLSKTTQTYFYRHLSFFLDSISSYHILG